MATNDSTTTHAEQVQPIVMTREQFNQLGQLIASNHADNRSFQKLQHAASGMDRCDGLVPEHVRTWIRALDGWQSEQVGDEFLLELAKATASGDLLEEIRARVNDQRDDGMHAIDDWPSLRSHVVDHFLSACESIKLQTQLETTKQRLGETTPAYIRRFRADASRAYGPTARAATEENRVVASFLRGLTDRHFAERLYRTGRVTKLEDAIKVALEKEAERERMEQMLRSAGQEPMEVGGLETTTRLLGLVDSMQRRLDQVSTRLSSMEASASNTAKGKPKAAPTKQPLPSRGAKGKRRRDHKWDEHGRPICNHCGKSGHIYRECPRRQQPTPSPLGGQ